MRSLKLKKNVLLQIWATQLRERWLSILRNKIQWKNLRKFSNFCFFLSKINHIWNDYKCLTDPFSRKTSRNIQLSKIGIIFRIRKNMKNFCDIFKIFKEACKWKNPNELLDFSKVVENVNFWSKFGGLHVWRLETPEVA